MPRGRFEKPITDAQWRLLELRLLKTGTLSRDKLAPFARQIGVSRRALMRKFLERQPLWQIRRPAAKEARGVLKSIAVYKPFEHLQVDLGHLQRFGDGARGYEYVFVCVDLYSRYVWLIALKNASQQSTANAMRRVLNSLPDGVKVKIVQTDNGSEFTGKFDDVLKSFDIRHTRGKAAVPQSQGAVEAAVKNVKNAIANTVKLVGPNWPASLRGVTEGLNERPHSSTGVPPVELATTDIPKALEDKVRERIDKALGRTTKKRLIEPDDVKVGDLVRYNIRSKNPLRKGWEPRWSEKVYRVTEIWKGRPDFPYKGYVLGGLPGKQPRRSLLKVQEPRGLRVMADTYRRGNVRDRREARQIRAEAAEQNALPQLTIRERERSDTPRGLTILREPSQRERRRPARYISEDEEPVPQRRRTS